MQENQKTLILPSASKVAVGDGSNIPSPLMREKGLRKSKRKQLTSWKGGNSENSFSDMV